jgi:putative flippase GtrA
MTLSSPAEVRPGLLRRLKADPFRRVANARLVRFAITGGSAGLIQLGLLRLLEGLGVTPILANALGFLFAAQANFLLSQTFTWADRPPDDALGEGLGQRWLRFHLAIAGTAVLNLAIFAVASAVLPDLVASALGIGVAGIANYLLADRLVFRRRSGDLCTARQAA